MCVWFLLRLASGLTRKELTRHDGEANCLLNVDPVVVWMTSVQIVNTSMLRIFVLYFALIASEVTLWKEIC